MPIRLSRTSRPADLVEMMRRVPDPNPTDGAAPASAPGGCARYESPHAPPFLSPKEAAAWLCVSLSTVKRLIGTGKLETVRIGARRKIPASSLEAYVMRDLLIPHPDAQPVDNDPDCTWLSTTS